MSLTIKQVASSDIYSESIKLGLLIRFNSFAKEIGMKYDFSQLVIVQSSPTTPKECFVSQKDTGPLQLDLLCSEGMFRVQANFTSNAKAKTFDNRRTKALTFFNNQGKLKGKSNPIQSNEGIEMTRTAKPTVAGSKKWLLQQSEELQAKIIQYIHIDSLTIEGPSAIEIFHTTAEIKLSKESRAAVGTTIKKYLCEECGYLVVIGKNGLSIRYTASKKGAEFVSQKLGEELKDLLDLTPENARRQLSELAEESAQIMSDLNAQLEKSLKDNEAALSRQKNLQEELAAIEDELSTHEATCTQLKRQASQAIQGVKQLEQVYLGALLE